MEITARLREEREALAARISKIDSMLEQYEEWGREAHQLLSLTPPSATPVPAPSGEGATPGMSREGRIRLRRRRVSPAQSNKTPIPEFEAAVIDVLRDAEQPMDRIALYEALTGRGIVIGGDDRDKELNALSARVYRMAQDPKTGISGERGQGYRLISDDPVDDVTLNEDGDDADGDLI